MDSLTRINELNRRFGISGTAEVVAGNGGLPALRVNTPVASGEIYLYGSQVMSWQPAGAQEVIFVSERSLWQEGQPIRGGVPICFPWFRAKSDDPHAPKHGFVRTRVWQLDSVTQQHDGSLEVVCSTESDESTRRWWPHDFHLLHRVMFGTSLSMELTVTNTGSTPLRFEEALHTYIRVGDAHKIRVQGLDGVSYLDNNDSNREKIQRGDLVIEQPTDFAFINSPGAAGLVDPVLGRTIRTTKHNSATTIVWNPWQQGAAALSDFGDEEWQQMTCVEAANIMGAAVSLPPGGRHAMHATLTVD
jgi:glucose-6-phosphate 1-epimerase